MRVRAADVMLLGTVVAIPATVVWGGGADIGPEAVLLLVIAGASSIIGLLLGYTALQRGKVAVIAPITSTEGAAGAVISILFGEQVATFAAVALTLIVAVEKLAPRGDLIGRAAGVALIAWGVLRIAV